VGYSNYDYSAQIQNSLLPTANDVLSPLVDPITGDDIEGFPERPRTIADMTATILDLVLE
jgi:hypothetical protein